MIPESSIVQFLSEHGGSCNAFTSDEHTNYFFDVSPEYLAPTLDRFVENMDCFQKVKSLQIYDWRYISEIFENIYSEIYITSVDCRSI